MKKYLWVALAGLSLVLFSAGCVSDDCCGGCKDNKDQCSCEEASCNCTELKAGGTGWCDKCDIGFFEGKEVKCQGQCQANPGGPPCEACVK